MVCRLLGSEEHCESTQLPADQHISHIFHSLHKKYSSKFLWIPTRTPSEDHCSMNSAFFRTLLKSKNYCATTAAHRWKISCLYCAKTMLSTYTSKEQVLQREGKTRPPLSPSEALLQGNWGTAACSASTAPLTQPQTLPGQGSTLNVPAKITRAETNGAFLTPSAASLPASTAVNPAWHTRYRNDLTKISLKTHNFPI